MLFAQLVQCPSGSWSAEISAAVRETVERVVVQKLVSKQRLGGWGARIRTWKWRNQNPMEPTAASFGKHDFLRLSINLTHRQSDIPAWNTLVGDTPVIPRKFRREGLAMRGKITKRAVDGIVITGGAAEFILWDTEIKGFGVRLRCGGAKTYILHYRAGKGRAAPLRKITIGKHGSPWTPETARTEAKQLMGQVAGGGDPCRDRAAERKAITLSDLCDLYLNATKGHAHRAACEVSPASPYFVSIAPVVRRRRSSSRMPS